MDALELLGKRMSQLEIGPKTLEKRINDLHLKQEQARAIVTGFVNDRLQGDRYGIDELFDLVNGWARWLYNGDHESVCRQMIEKKLPHMSSQETERFFKQRNDPAGLQKAAELAIKENPVMTFELYQGEDRAEKLRQIIELHAKEPKYGQFIAQCYKELKDTEGLRAFAKKNLKKSETTWAVNILTELGTDEDLRAVAKNSTNTAFAYQQLEKIRDKTPEDEKRMDELKEKLIKHDPRKAEDLFVKYEHRYYRQKAAKNKEVMLEIGKSYLRKGEHQSALEAFELAEHNGEHYIQAGLELLRQREIKWFSNDDEYARKASNTQDKALRAAALTFFEQGGDPNRANAYIPQNVDDDLNRKLGCALAELKPDGNGRNAENAYKRLKLIGKKTEEDNKQIQKLRRRIVDEQKEYAGRIFTSSFDKEGLKQFIDEKLEVYTKSVYEAACAQGSPEDVVRAREALAEKGLSGKISLHKVYEIFKEAGDEVGLQWLNDKLAPEAPKKLVEKLLSISK